MVFSEFLEFLDGHKYAVLNTKELFLENSIEQRGSFYGKRGNDYELHLVKELSCPNNLIKFKRDELDNSDVFNIVLKKLLNDNRKQSDDVIKLEVTNSIPLLMHGGNPKTDILVRIELLNDLILEETISIKNTNSSQVSCHDYTAKDYIRVLNAKDSRLEEYLKLFQKYPSLKKFTEMLDEGYSVEDFENLLANKSEVFCKWVLKGENDSINLTNPDLQTSKYLLINKDDNIAFYSMDNYIQLILSKSKKTFGVPFAWTYPSKQRGKRIQLKVPIIMKAL